MHIERQVLEKEGRDCTFHSPATTLFPLSPFALLRSSNNANNWLLFFSTSWSNCSPPSTVPLLDTFPSVHKRRWSKAWGLILLVSVTTSYLRFYRSPERGLTRGTLDLGMASRWPELKLDKRAINFPTTFSKLNVWLVASHTGDHLQAPKWFWMMEMVQGIGTLHPIASKDIDCSREKTGVQSTFLKWTW